jgi:hypothetical protein
LTEIGDSWNHIQLALNVENYKITNNNEEDKIIKLSQVLQAWIDADDQVTWAKIISVLEGPIVNKKRQAKSIKQFLCRPDICDKYKS